MKPRSFTPALRSVDDVPLPVALVLTLVLVVPNYFNPYTTMSFEPDKMQWLRAAGIVAAASLVVRRGAMPRRVGWLLVAGVLAALAATLASVSPAISFWGSDVRAGGLLTALALAALAAALAPYLRLPWVRRVLMHGVVWGSVPVVTMALAEAAGLHPLRTVESAAVAGRVASLLGNPVFLGAYLVLALPVTAWLAWQASGRARWAYSLALAGQAAAWLLAEARGPWLGLFVAGGLAALLGAAWQRRQRLALGVVLFAGTGAILLGALSQPPAASFRTVPLVGRLVGLADAGGTGGQRLLIWQGVVDALRAHPWRVVAGWGPDALALAYYPHYPPRLAEYEPDAVVRLPDRAHNMGWDAIAAGGLPFVLVAGALGGMALVAGLERLQLLATRRDRTALAVALAVGAAAVSALAALVAPARALAWLPLALSSGLLAGLGGWLTWRAVARREAARAAKPLHAGGESVALLAALAGHFVEVQFGFAVSATALLAGLYVLCLLVPASSAAEDAAPEPPRAARAVAPLVVLASAFGPVMGGDPAGVVLALVLAAVAIAFAFATGRGPRQVWVPILLWPLGAALVLALLARRTEAGPLLAWLLLAGAFAAGVRWLSAPRGRITRRGVVVGAATAMVLALLVLRPALADLAHKQGLLLAAAGRVAEGYRWVARAAFWHPAADTYRHSLAALHLPLAERNPAEADALHAQAMRLLDDGWQARPHLVAYAGWLADLAARMGDGAAAAHWYEAGLRSFPGNVEWMAALARLYVADGDGAAAEALLQRLEEVAPRYYPTYIVWGDGLARQGQTDAARAKYRMAVEVAPWAAEAQRAWAQAQESPP